MTGWAGLEEEEDKTGTARKHVEHLSGREGECRYPEDRGGEAEGEEGEGEGEDDVEDVSDSMARGPEKQLETCC
eukprot:768446-Hanusia_phi.AAC.3